MNLEQEVVELQRQLATVDLLSRPSRQTRSGWTEFLLLKRGELKIKMYQESGHTLPHVHVDYGSHHHVASYSIDPIERLAGNLDKKYELVVTEWISTHRTQLLDVWQATQVGAETHVLISALSGDA
jgi:hypothetical protein